jgi:DNA gyrase inhibitor GyrI
MDAVKVKTVTLDGPLTVVGKIFTGDYANSPAYITEVQKELEAQFIPFVPYTVIGVYYDNPQTTPAAGLKSFQGVFVQDEGAKINNPLTRMLLQGNYLHVKVTGEPMKAIYDGYGALFSYIQANNVTLKSPAGYQVSTFENGSITTEIYMELAL